MSSTVDRTPVESDPIKVGPPQPFDPELAAGLAVIHEQFPSTVTSADVPILRAKLLATAASDEDLTCGGRFAVEHVSAPGPEDAPEVPLIVCRPTATSTPVGVIYCTHGGGMISGTHRGVELQEALGWAVELGLAVVSPDYRLAPEHPHPAPVEDCYSGLVYIAKHPDELGIDPANIVLSGASAGAGLTAAMALLARDRGGPAVIGQMLIEPMLDDRCNTPSAHQMAGLGIWDRDSDILGWTALLGDQRGGPDVPYYAAPARAKDLSGLPPTYIDVGSAETFRDESVEFASRLWRDGVVAELHVWPGGYHGYDMYAPQAALSQATKAPRIAWLRRILRF